MGVTGWSGTARALCAMGVGPVLGITIIIGWWMVRRPVLVPPGDEGINLMSLGKRGRHARRCPILQDPGSTLRPCRQALRRDLWSAIRKRARQRADGLAARRVFSCAARCFPDTRGAARLGSGTGNEALALAKSGYSVLGIDVSPAMVRQAQTKMAVYGMQRCVELSRAAAALSAQAGRARPIPGRVFEPGHAQHRAESQPGSRAICTTCLSRARPSWPP